MTADDLPPHPQYRDKVGERWRPDEGDHAGHVMVLVSADTRVVTLPGFPPVRHCLVRCETCLHSWTYGTEFPLRDDQ